MGTIEWTDATWNPIIGCSKTSRGCENCWALAMARRQTQRPEYAGLVTPAGWSGQARLVPERLVDPLRRRSGQRVAVALMGDLGHPTLSDEDRDQVFGVMAACEFLGPHAFPGHTFQVLTKRPEVLAAYLRQDRRERWARAAVNYGGRYNPDGLFDQIAGREGPLPHVWLGTSVEDQRAADERIPVLMGTPAAVRWVSLEPLLGPVDLRDDLPRFDEPDGSCSWCALRHTTDRRNPKCPPGYLDGAPKVDWVVVGGESGPGARPCDLSWIRSVVEQCRAAQVPCFVKQLGSRSSVRRLNHPKGADPAEWPADLRVRQFPSINSGPQAATDKEPTL